MLPSPMATLTMAMLTMAILTMAILTMGLEARGQQLYYGCTLLRLGLLRSYAN